MGAILLSSSTSWASLPGNDFESTLERAIGPIPRLRGGPRLEAGSTARPGGMGQGPHIGQEDDYDRGQADECHVQRGPFSTRLRRYAGARSPSTASNCSSAARRSSTI